MCVLLFLQASILRDGAALRRGRTILDVCFVVPTQASILRDGAALRRGRTILDVCFVVPTGIHSPGWCSFKTW